MVLIYVDFLLQHTLPCAEYYKRNGFSLKKIVQFASNRDYTDLVVLNEDRKGINGLLLVHLPDGPTAHFKLSNLVLGKQIKVCVVCVWWGAWGRCLTVQEVDMVANLTFYC